MYSKVSTALRKIAEAFASAKIRNKRDFIDRLEDRANYLFAALVAKTDIDLLALDKDLITPSEVITKLIVTMEEYANYGFSVMADKLGSNENFFYENTSFLNLFLNLLADESTNDELESLD